MVLVDREEAFDSDNKNIVLTFLKLKETKTQLIKDKRSEIAAILHYWERKTASSQEGTRGLSNYILVS